MVLNQEIKSVLGNMSNVMYKACEYSFKCGQMEGSPVYNNYDVWLFNGIIEDISALTCLINATVCVESTTGRPLHCIIRSTMEKYADLINFCTRQNQYERYLLFLRNSADGKYSPDEEMSEKKLLRNQLDVKKVNRKTRYYLLGRSEKLFSGLVQINNFNHYLARKDSEMSSILHNNIQEKPKGSKLYIIEAIQDILCMAYGSMYAMSLCYEWGKIDKEILEIIENAKRKVDFHINLGTMFLA